MNTLNSVILKNDLHKKNIAKYAKVSVSNLSRFIHGKRKITFEVKIKIVEAINSLLAKKPI
jgi:plasmid maintenance system antidote protein VapI